MHRVGVGSSSLPTVQPDPEDDRNLERRVESECNADTVSVVPGEISPRSVDLMSCDIPCHHGRCVD